MPLYTIGLHYRSTGVLAVLVRLNDGVEIANSEADYSHGVLDWGDPLAARIDPADFFDSTDEVLKAVLTAGETGDSSFKRELVVGIGVAAVACTPVPMDGIGIPLAARSQFRKNGYAMAWLWKDNTSYIEANKITDLLRADQPSLLSAKGGVYSGEAYWSKLAHHAKVDPATFDLCANHAELHDFVAGFLSGTAHHMAMKRGASGAGHFGLYDASWGGYPPNDFLSKVDPNVNRIRANLPAQVYACGTAAGNLTSDWTTRLRMREGVPVSVGGVDACLAGLAAGANDGVLVIDFGEQTSMIAVCDSALSLDLTALGSSAIGSVLPGRKAVLVQRRAPFELFDRLVASFDSDPADMVLPASLLKPAESGIIVRDWLIMAGREEPIAGKTAATQHTEILRGLVEASAFLARRLIEALKSAGAQTTEIIVCGQAPSELLGVYANVCNRAVKVARSSHPAALGAAMAGSVVAGAFSEFGSVRSKLGGLTESIYVPDPQSVAAYEKLFQSYSRLVAGEQPSAVEPDLLALKNAVTMPTPTSTPSPSR